LTRDLLFDRLQKALPLLILVLLGLKLGLRQLADQPLSERPFLVADLGLGALGDLGRVMDLVGEVAARGEARLGVCGSRSASSCGAR